MDIRKHISFRPEEHPALLRYFEENRLPINVGKIIASFDLYESDPHWSDIDTLLKLGKSTCISDTVYTKAELTSAEWLTVRSQWRCGYPQPEASFRYRNTTYSGENYCDTCGAGLEQKAPFCIKKSPNWSKRSFMMLNWVEDELFASEAAKVLLEKTGFSGFRFQQVNNKNGSSVLQDVYQLEIPSILKPGMEPNRCSVDRIERCPNCGAVKYHPTGIGMLAFRREIFEHVPDISKTSELFGWGHGASRRIVLRQSMYQYLTDHQLHRGLIFEPIELL